ncbi:MAG: acyltransferase [Fuerstiella sp.]
MTKESTSRIPSLDGLRAISVVMVLAAHSALTVDFPEPLVPFFRIGGQIGVRVFFVLSGFLITSLLIREQAKSSSVSLTGFYLRRSLRIFPVYVCYLLAVVLFTYVSGLSIGLDGYVHAATFTTGVRPGDNWALAHTWSLSVEEQFYLFWPFLFAFAAPLLRKRLAIGIALVIPFTRILFWAWGAKWLVQYSFLGNGDAIMWGCVSALVLAETPSLVKKLAQSNPQHRLLTATFVLFGMEIFHRGHFWPALSVPLTLTVESFAIVFIIYSVTQNRSGMVFDILNHPIVSRVGVLSYSIYLWQQLALYPASENFTPYVWQRFPQNILVALVVAVLSYNLIEKPFLNLKEKLRREKRVDRPLPMVPLEGRVGSERKVA